MKIFLRLLAILSIIITAGSAVYLFAKKPGKSGGIESKIALETSMEKRLKTVLTEITGTDKIIVIVNITLMEEEKDEG